MRAPIDPKRQLTKFEHRFTPSVVVATKIPRFGYRTKNILMASHKSVFEDTVSALRGKSKTGLTGFTVLVFSCLAACSSTDRPPFIAIDPPAATVEAGGSITLTVVAHNTHIVWPDTVDGDFALNGNRVIYTPPAAEGQYKFPVMAAADGTTVTASVEVFVPPTPEITSFDLPGFAPGIIDHTTNTIEFSTRDWIDGLEALTAEFSAVGTVTVDGVEQTSGVTANNFYRDVVYTVATGEFARRSYTVRIESPQTTGLPVIRIDTENNQPITSKEDYLQMNIQVVDPENPDHDFVRSEFEDQIRGRGNSTWTYPKKPFRIKFDKKRSMFGLTAAKSWVLLANYQDPTLMLNSITFELGQRFGLPFTNHYVHVELFLNGEYQGSYVLTEHVQVGEGRVDIDEDAGFFVELDTYYDEDPKFTTAHYALPVMIKSPEDLTDPAGYDFVQDAIHILETAMIGPSFPDSGYRNLIDMGTFVDFLLINQFVMNVELIWPKSMYMYKDAGGPIGLGPLWDFDWAFGYGGIGHQYFLQANSLVAMHPFFSRFFDDPVFVARFKERWASVQEELAEMPQFIEALAKRLERSQAQNFWKWPATQNNGHDREIEDLLRWWRERIDYLDATITAMN